MDILVIHYLLKSYKFMKQLDKLVNHLTTDIIDKPNKRYSIYSKFKRFTYYPSEQPHYINNISTLGLIKRSNYRFINNAGIYILDVGKIHRHNRTLEI